MAIENVTLFLAAADDIANRAKNTRRLLSWEQFLITEIAKAVELILRKGCFDYEARNIKGMGSIRQHDDGSRQ